MNAAALLLGLVAAKPGPGCPSAEALPGPGSDDPFRAPAAAAYALNRRGRELYQQQRFEEARAQYRAAVATDPAFVAPLLNVACSFAREERFDEAVAEALALAGRAYVPWGREILEAADLAPLRTRPAMQRLNEGLGTAARAWAAPLGEALLFVARTRPPVRLTGQGVLHLGLGQEIFAWLPATGRYRQVTAEDGRVLAFVPARDEQRLVLVRAGKLVRADGQLPALRDLSLRSLDLRTLSLGPPVAIEGDVQQLEVVLAGAAARVTLQRAGRVQSLDFDGQRLVPAATPGRPRGAPGVVLDATGVPAAAKTPQGQGDCRFSAADVLAAAAPPAVRITAGKRSFTLKAPWGAGLLGLPFPP